MGKTFSPGLYLHIPFCQSKCGYCDFYSVTDLEQRTPFLGALESEIALSAGLVPEGVAFDTIYLGGGTPSLLTPAQIARILDRLSEVFRIAAGAEITLEINPGTADRKKLHEYRRTGINRLSIGIQSFDDQQLRLLQRIHTAAQARESIRAARSAGFDNISLDFIYGLPGQSRTAWRQTLKTALTYQPEHISAYSLIIEPDTPFYRQAQDGRLRVPGDDRVAGYFIDTRQILTDAHYVHYEISNFARTESLRSRHNAKYWEHIPYLGLGPSAHSFWQRSRWGNQRSISGYIRNLTDGRTARAFSEKLTRTQLMSEHIMLALRTAGGVGISEFNRRYRFDFLGRYGSTVSTMINAGFGRMADDHFFLTEKGMLVCDEITLQFSA